MLPLGDAILLWRVERRLSQNELARRAGVSRPNLSAMQGGKRDVSLRTLRAIALALGVSPGVLADGKGPLDLHGTLRVSRRVLERIAGAVAYETSVTRREDAEIVRLLRAVTCHQLAAAHGGARPPRAGRRAMNRAWLQLSSACPPDVLSSLLQRIADCTALRPARP